MGRHAFDFLSESLMWSQLDRDDELREISDDDLKAELARYRAHVLSESVKPSGKLAVAVSARQNPTADVNAIKRSILYFDDVMLPDPVFHLTERTRKRVRLFPTESEAVPRRELIHALRYMREFTPMVQLGRVRFIPSTHALESPEHLPFYMPDDAFLSLVPEQLRDWFYKRVRVRKVVTDNLGRRLVLGQGPDRETQSILIDFGQLGRPKGQDHMSLVKVTDDREVLLQATAPEDEETMQQWIFQSVNKAAADFLGDVLTDAETAWKLGASFVTSCTATAELLDRIRMQSDDESAGALALELPMVETASFRQIAELLQTIPAAFEAFRFELKAAAEALASIDDVKARDAEAKKISERLARDQVNEVERKMLEANRKLKWNIPITLSTLGAGALGFAAGAQLLLMGIGVAIQGGAAVMSMLRDQQSYRALPGYFLWKLKRST